METEFVVLYQEVKPIVLKLRQTYQIRLWDREDWEQEGMIVLHQLISQHPDIMNSQLLFTYFKTKFSNYIKDQLRKQESQKRRLNKLSYEDISEVGHLIPSSDMQVSERVVYREMCDQLEHELNTTEQELLQRVMAGESFAGKARFIRKLRQIVAAYADH